MVETGEGARAAVVRGVAAVEREGEGMGEGAMAEGACVGAREGKGCLAHVLGCP